MDTKRTVGWDVGIKHLALCVIEKTEISFKIDNDEWKIINLTDSDQIKCCGLIKKTKKNINNDNNDNIICNALGKFSYETDNGTKYLCGTHKSQYTLNINDIESKYVTLYDNINEPDDNTNDEPYNNTNNCKYRSTRLKKVCQNDGKFVIDNCVCCEKHKNLKLKEKIKECSLKPIKKTKCTSTNPQVLCNNMYDKLDNLEYLKNVNNVRIENQPALKNPTMKTVSSMLFSYFCFISKSNNIEMDIKFVSPGAKICIDKDLIKFINEYITEHNQIKRINCKCRICKLDTELKNNTEKFNDTYTKYKFGYDSIKELGIIYTFKIFKDNNMNENLEYLKTHDKKDDLCDAFLHAYKNMK